MIAFFLILASYTFATEENLVRVLQQNLESRSCPIDPNISPLVRLTDLCEAGGGRLIETTACPSAELKKGQFEPIKFIKGSVISFSHSSGEYQVSYSKDGNISKLESVSKNWKCTLNSARDQDCSKILSKLRICKTREVHCVAKDKYIFLPPFVSASYDTMGDQLTNLVVNESRAFEFSKSEVPGKLEITEFDPLGDRQGAQEGQKCYFQKGKDIHCESSYCIEMKLFLTEKMCLNVPGSNCVPESTKVNNRSDRKREKTSEIPEEILPENQTKSY